MSFHIRQKVVCVDDTEEVLLFHCIYGETRPIKGKIYTVRGLDTYTCTRGVTYYGVYLEEIVNPPGWYGSPARRVEQFFDSYRFRPLIEKSTDTGMAILKKIAQGVSKYEKVG